MKVLISPYIVNASGTKPGITLDEEIAAVSCLAFCKRRRVGIVTGRIEEIKALSRAYYPLICAPWNKRGCFIIDGLGFLGFNFPDIAVPDMLQFTESLKENSVVLKKFMETLDYGIRLFTNITKGGTKDYRLNYLVGERDLLETISSLSERSPLIDLTEEEKPKLIQPRLQISQVRDVVEEVVSILNRLNVEVSMLRYVLKVLEGEIDSHLNALSKESALVMREYKRREKEFETKMDKRIRFLEEKRLKEIDETRRKYEKKIKALLKEKEKTEKVLLRNKILTGRSSKKRNSKRKSTGTKVDLYLSRIEELAKRTKDLQRAIEEIETEKNNRIRSIERKYDALIMDEKNRIEVLRESRDADISRINRDIEKIKEAYSVIKGNIIRIIDEKERSINVIKERLLPIKVDETVIIGIPFYMIMYEGRKKSRLDFYPPVKLSEAADKILERDLEQRIIHLLTPLKETWSVVISVLTENWDKDPYLSSEVKRIINGENILLSKNFMENLRHGLNRLKENKWLNSHEERAIINFYSSKINSAC
ncbi:MAG: hypothetical protein QXS79_06340 [Candidatus Bathyarchaeia archaeon]